MILSHAHQFIFLKTNKTAGTSIEVALSQHCGPDDIITPISRRDEKLRRAPGYRGPQHFQAAWRSYTFTNWKRLILKARPKKLFYNHMSATEVRTRIEPAVWERYFTFCFTRNPWDRVVSMYFWKTGSKKIVSLDSFLESQEIISLQKRGWELYTDNGRIVVDIVYRYEELLDAMRDIGNRIGLAAPLALPRTKSGYRPDRRHYRDILTPQQRDRIAELFAPEIACFGYEF